MRHSEPGEVEAANTGNALLVNRIFCGVADVGMWYILQNRELKNFFNMREAQEIKDKAINKES